MKKALGIVLVALMLMAMGAGYKLGRREANRARPAMAQALEHEESDPLLAFRTQREQLRSRQRAELNEIIHDADTDGQTLRAAREQLLRSLESEETESRLEGLLRARGFDDAVVDAPGGAVNVLLRAEGLNQRQIAMILELVLRETGVTGGNVKIIPVN